MRLSSSSLVLGENVCSRRAVKINAAERKTHMHIIGSTGEGKSKFMEHLIREDIWADNGLCLIDPHGYLYNDLVNWCETNHFLSGARGIPKKIILFDPSEEDWTFGFNPLRLVASHISFQVDYMIKACGAVWGDEDMNNTPLLKRCLTAVFYTLIEKKLSLFEAQLLVDPTNQTARQYLTHDLQDKVIFSQWNYFNALK
jgi:hypothetical protein